MLSLLFGFLSPRIERGTLSGADTGKDMAALIALQGVFVKVGPHAGIVQARGAIGADTPLCLQCRPDGPGLKVAGPQVVLGIPLLRSVVGQPWVCFGWLVMAGLRCNGGGELR